MIFAPNAQGDEEHGRACEGFVWRSSGMAACACLKDEAPIFTVSLNREMKTISECIFAIATV